MRIIRKFSLYLPYLVNKEGTHENKFFFRYAGPRNLTLAPGYYQSIIQAGGVPVVIPPYEDVNLLINTLEQLDGLLLTGGGDLNPLFLHEDPIRELHSINPYRDRQELLLTRLAANRQIPILGICRGMQVINAALGGTLYQDIYAQKDNTPSIKHSQDLERSFPSHRVELAEGSLLARILNVKEVAVNSFHHQAVKEAAPGERSCSGFPCIGYGTRWSNRGNRKHRIQIYYRGAVASGMFHSESRQVHDAVVRMARP